MKFVIVPTSLSNYLHRQIDLVLEGMPDEAQADREELYRQLLTYYNEHGRVPEFTIERREEDPSAGPADNLRKLTDEGRFDEMDRQGEGEPKPTTCEVCGVRLNHEATDARCYMHTHEREGTEVSRG